MNEWFSRFPDTNPDRLWMLLAGRVLTAHEYRYWYGRLYRLRKLFPLCALIMVAVLGLNMVVSVAESALATWEKLTVSALLLLTLAGVFVAVWQVLRLPEQYGSFRYKAYAADTAAAVNGTVIAVYGDRLTVTSLRGERVWRFADITDCVQTYAGFALSNGDEWLILRAADMTPFDAQMLEAYLTERLDNRVWREKQPVRPRLIQPLPIPVFPKTTSAVIATATVPRVVADTLRARKREQDKWLLWAVGTLMALCGFGAAVWLPFCDTVWVSLAAYVGGFTVFGTLLMQWFRYLVEPRESGDITVRFETDGVRFAVDGISQFCPKEYLYLQADSAGVLLYFHTGERFYIPAGYADNPEALLQFCGIAITR